MGWKLLALMSNMRPMSDAYALPTSVTLPAKDARSVRAVCRISTGIRAQDLEALYVDLSSARGSASRMSIVEADIRSSLDTYVRYLLVGHVGCGKSSELRWLEQSLNKKRRGTRFRAVFVDVNSHVDARTIRLPELLMSIFVSLAEDSELKKFVPASTQAKAIWTDITTTLRGMGFELEAEIPVGIAKLKAGFKREPGLQKTVGDLGQREVQKLIAGLNKLISSLRTPLIAADYGFDDIVIIVDNLERVERVTLSPTSGETTQDQFFLNELPRLQELEVHLVMTLPLAMQRQGGRVQNAFPSSCSLMLPMITVHQRGARDSGGKRLPKVEGVNVVRSMLAKRIDLDSVFADSSVSESLIIETGGNMRDLLRVLAEAVLLHPNLKLTHADIAEVLAQEAVTFGRGVEGSSHFDTLIFVAKTGRFPEGTSEALQRSLLNELLVLEYNGESWFDIHPAVERSAPYRFAVESRLASQRRTPSVGQ